VRRRARREYGAPVHSAAMSATPRIAAAVRPPALRVVVAVIAIAT
jgi:hypothetical protein